MFDHLVAEIGADPQVVGIVLTGSHARGTATDRSDIDLCVVTHAPRERRREKVIDEFSRTPRQLADTSDTYQRYTFRGARVLLDRGGVQPLVDQQATPTPAEARTWARDNLDGYVNFLYRAAKSQRDGHPTAAALDLAESIPWLLTTVFALHGRLRPYNKYLSWELEKFPLGDPWNALPERASTHPASLFPDVERLARTQGHADLLDSWGDDLSLIHRSFDPSRGIIR
ncbi:nucleotidyltransferase domain-containing protein [Actinoplanes sp. NPDC089786]|uniref:nucleotidyltransferase domain-containing protein n=1 Tax=Actinoplanes sp. NPDC089786 TaxID=3155185 RepID=UPI00343C427C